MGLKGMREAVPGPVITAFLLGAIVTLAAYLTVSGFEYARVSGDFQRSAQARVTELRAGFRDAIDELETVQRLFATSADVSREQFEQFTAPMIRNNPHIRAFSFHRIVSAAERPAYEAARQARFPGLRITEPAERGGGVAAPRASYRVLDYTWPMAGLEGAIGIDLGAVAGQRDAADRACASGAPAMTRLHRLLRPGDRAGVVLLAPVYRAGADLSTAAARCAAVRGYVAAVLSMHRFADLVLRQHEMLGQRGFSVNLYVGAPSPASLVFRDGHGPLAADTRPYWLRAATSRVPEDVAGIIDAAGHRWTVVVSPDPVASPRTFLAAALVLAGGLICTWLAAAQAFGLAVRNRSVRRMVDERTAELTRANHALALLRQAVEACDNGILVVGGRDSGYRIDYANPAFERITGYTVQDINRAGWQVLGQPDARDQAAALQLRAALEQEREAHAVRRIYRKDGQEIWSDVHVAPVRDPDGVVRHFVLVHYDITEYKRYQDELLYRANYDMQTGLANRSLLVERMDILMERAARENKGLWLMFLDLDRFKFINDRMGHHVADEFLRAMAARLKSAVRECDTVARLHGDEFLIAFPEQDDAPLSTALVQCVLDRVAEPIVAGGHEFSVSCSAGIAQYPSDGATPDELIDNADLAMYKAKELGRDNVQFFDAGMNLIVQERLRMERSLRGALELGQLELRYQPKFDLTTGALVGMEALLRWESPEFGTVMPDRFLPLAEENELIVRIGEWVLRTACAQVQAWKTAGLGSYRIAVNLSGRQFRQPNLVDMVARVLHDTGLAAAQLELELTESLVMDDVGRAVDVMYRLRELGVGLSVDDFGTGYSSLASLSRFPVDALKIDKSFVHEMTPYSNETSIPDAIISMAHSLGMRVVAEGVETESQCEFLSRNMCDEVQGFLWSVPLATAEMEASLREGTRLPDRLLRLYKRQRTLLLVDDEPNILSSLKRLIRTSGYRILTASSGPQGLEVLAQNEVDVIVSDQRMPGMTGVDFLRTVKTLYPDTVRIVLSGFTELQSVTDAVNEGAIYKFLTKPWDDAQLRGHIEEAFAHKEMADENRRLGLEVRTANQGLAQANRQLESVLKQQERQIERDEIMLDVVREGLQHVPLPIVGLADDMLIAFANLAAQRLFGAGGMLLGEDARKVTPQLVIAIRGLPHAHRCVVEVNGQRFEVESRRMGNDESARGVLLTLTPLAVSEALQAGAQPDAVGSMHG